MKGRKKMMNMIVCERCEILGNIITKLQDKGWKLILINYISDYGILTKKGVDVKVGLNCYAATKRFSSMSREEFIKLEEEVRCQY